MASKNYTYCEVIARYHLMFMKKPTAIYGIHFSCELKFHENYGRNSNSRNNKIILRLFDWFKTIKPKRQSTETPTEFSRQHTPEIVNSIKVDQVFSQPAPNKPCICLQCH